MPDCTQCRGPLSPQISAYPGKDLGQIALRQLQIGASSIPERSAIWDGAYYGVHYEGGVQCSECFL